MSNKKQINLNGFKTLLEEISLLDHGKDAQQLSPIIEQMLQMSSLLEEYSQLADEKDRLEMAKRIYRCREESQKALHEVLQQHGTNYEEAKLYFGNPENFKSSEWQDIQSMHQKIDATISQ
jgi:hypothetical protein